MCPLKAEQTDCRANPDGNANHMSTYQEEVRQGHEPPLRLPGLDFKQSPSSRLDPSGRNSH